ncbi:MAG: hypothetical protein II820_04305, partial [Ruminiclostridium sp.]|nr:hypothetical protein [Ruminiclostridium sp.]
FVLVVGSGFFPFALSALYHTEHCNFIADFLVFEKFFKFFRTLCLSGFPLLCLYYIIPIIATLLQILRIFKKFLQ